MTLPQHHPNLFAFDINYINHFITEGNCVAANYIVTSVTDISPGRKMAKNHNKNKRDHSRSPDENRVRTSDSFLRCDGCDKTVCSRCADFSAYTRLQTKEVCILCNSISSNQADSSSNTAKINRKKSCLKKSGRFREARNKSATECNSDGSHNDNTDFNCFWLFFRDGSSPYTCDNSTMNFMDCPSDTEDGNDDINDGVITTEENYFRTFTSNKNGKYIRADRNRKIPKARKQIKTKHCRSLRNKESGKILYVRSRVYKRMYQLKERSDAFHKALATKSNNIVPETDNRPLHSTQEITPSIQPPEAANVKHALHSGNAPEAFRNDPEFLTLLTSMQHRDLTPEDYDLLLQLDDVTVPAKTIAADAISNLLTERVTTDLTEVCPVCMEPYSLGQIRSFLPCDHVFHSLCIEKWLRCSSQNCPLDGLPVVS